jgi:hypothetical protein
MPAAVAAATAAVVLRKSLLDTDMVSLLFYKRLMFIYKVIREQASVSLM